MADYYPDAIRDILGDSGTFTGGPAKGVLHTTEGKSYAGARSAYVANRSNPHFTVTFEKGYFQCYQHCSIGRASRALKNLSGGAQTNRDMAIQIEIVGSCNPPNAHWGNLYVPTFPQAYLDGIGKLMRWIEANAGVGRFTDATFKAYPGSYGNNGVRFSANKWDNYNGWCGHQHVPENTHGDPGNIDINYLLNVGVVVKSESAPVVERGPETDELFKEKVMALPELHPGDTGHYVKNLQALMIAHAPDLVAWFAGGFDKVAESVDGVYGMKTAAVVMEWQKRTQALRTDAVVDAAVWAWLVGV